MILRTDPWVWRIFRAKLSCNTRIWSRVSPNPIDQSCPSNFLPCDFPDLIKAFSLRARVVQGLPGRGLAFRVSGALSFNPLLILPEYLNFELIHSETVTGAQAYSFNNIPLYPSWDLSRLKLIIPFYGSIEELRLSRKNKEIVPGQPVSYQSLLAS